MTPKEIIVKAHQLIAEHGWVRGYYGSAHVGYCAIGAICAAHPDQSGVNTGALADIIAAIGMVERRLGKHSSLVMYNDAYGRTKEEILNLLEECIK